MISFQAHLKEGRLSFGTEFNKARFLEFARKNPKATFRIIVQKYESRKMRRYLEGGVIGAYAEWQYGINPRDPQKREDARYFFMRDFNYEIVKNRKGNPQRCPQSSVGIAGQVLDTYTDFAEQNGAPIPNVDLFKLYRDKWATDFRFPSFHDFLHFLDIECDAMPSAETLGKLVNK